MRCSKYTAWSYILYYSSIYNNNILLLYRYIFLHISYKKRKPLQYNISVAHFYIIIIVRYCRFCRVTPWLTAYNTIYRTFTAPDNNIRWHWCHASFAYRVHRRWKVSIFLKPIFKHHSRTKSKIRYQWCYGYGTKYTARGKCGVGK